MKKENITTLAEVLKPHRDLDKAVREFPGYFYSVSEAHASAVGRRDIAKAKLERAEGLARDRLHNSATTARVTKERSDIAVMLDSDVILCAKTFREINREVAQWFALLEAFKQKSYMLKAEVELTVSQWAQRDNHISKDRGR